MASSKWGFSSKLTPSGAGELPTPVVLPPVAEPVEPADPIDPEEPEDGATAYEY